MAAAALGLSGKVDEAVIENLYMEGIGPGGERLLRPRVPKPVRERETAAVGAYLAEHPFASETELAEVRAAERAKEAAKWVPYCDPDHQRGQVGQRAAHLAEGGREAGPRRR